MRRALLVMVAIMIGMIASVLSSWVVEFSRDDEWDLLRSLGAVVEGVGWPISPGEAWSTSPYQGSHLARPYVFRRESAGLAVWTYRWEADWGEGDGPIWSLTEMRTGWPMPCLRRYMASLGSVRLPTADEPVVGVWRGGIDFGAKPSVNGNVLRLPVAPVWGGLMVNTAVYASCVGVLMVLWSWGRRGWLARLARRGRCGSCGYPRGASALCTECGTPRGGQVKDAGVGRVS